MGFWKFFKKDKRETYLALDIGTESIKALIFKPRTSPRPELKPRGEISVRGKPARKQEAIEILGIGRAPLDSNYLTGRVPYSLSIEKLLLGAGEAIKKAQSRAKTIPSRAIIGLGGEFIKGKTSEYTFKRANPEEKISFTELKNLIQKAEWKIFDEIKSNIKPYHFPESSEIKLIDAEIEEMFVNDDKVNNPLDFPGKRVSLKIFNSFCDRSFLEGLEKIPLALNLENSVLASTSYATAKTLIAQKKDLEAILIDIGGQTTEVSIIKDNGLLGNFTFNIGARGFTECISRALEVGFPQAEQIKLKYSENKVSSKARENVGKILEKGFKFWRAGISLGLEQQSWRELPRQILLFGGGSLLPGLQRALGDSGWKENLPFTKTPVVKIIRPEDFKRIYNLTGQVLSPEDTTTLTLAAFFVDLQRKKKNLSKILYQAVRVAAGDNNSKFLTQTVGFSTTQNTNMTQKQKGNTPIRMTDIIRRKRPRERIFLRKEVLKSLKPKVVFKPKQRFDSTHHKKIILSAISSKSIFVFLLVSMLAAGLVLFLALPRAKIEILPKTESLSLDLQIIADTNLDIEDILAQKIPAKIILASSKSSETFPTTEKKLLQQKARGVIQVSNEWSSQAQPLVETTRFLSEEGKLFKTLKAVVVPGAKIVDGGTQAGTIDVEVEAADIGQDYNIGPSTFTIPAFKEYGQLKKYSAIYGKSKSPMAGGANREELVVLKEDIERAKTELIQALSEEVTSEFYGQLLQGYKLMEDASRLEKKNIASSHKAGEAAKDFSVEAEVSLEAIVFSQRILESFINSLLYSKIPEGRTMISETQEITYNEAEPDFEKGQLKLNIHVQQSLIYEIDEELLKKELVGKDKSQVEEILLTYTTIERAKVLLWPFWVKKVPSSSRRISIVLTK